MGLNQAYEAVKAFHKAFGHPVEERPKAITVERAKARANWMEEEIHEFLEATEKQDVVGMADAMIDLMYFALGTMVEMGVEPENLFQIVQEANMGKLWEDGKPRYREDGKIKKPPYWEERFAPEPRLHAEIERQMKKIHS